jgi:hypothetical protein
MIIIYYCQSLLEAQPQQGTQDSSPEVPKANANALNNFMSKRTMPILGEHAVCMTTQRFVAGPISLDGLALFTISSSQETPPQSIWDGRRFGGFLKP